MKHIIKIEKFNKTHKELKYKYKIGDYVVLNLDEISKKAGKLYATPTYNIAKIIDYEYGGMYKYVIFFDEAYQDRFYIREIDIIRLATPDEIYACDNKETLDKYNL